MVPHKRFYLVSCSLHVSYQISETAALAFRFFNWAIRSDIVVHYWNYTNVNSHRRFHDVYMSLLAAADDSTIKNANAVWF